jgi:primosomal protein N'
MFSFLKKQDYPSFFHWQIKERKEFGYPPFSKMMVIREKDGSKQAKMLNLEDQSIFNSEYYFIVSVYSIILLEYQIHKKIGWIYLY